MTGAVLFDCDGVLVESEALSKGLMAEMMRDIGIERDAGEVLHEFSGRRLSDCLAEVATWLGKPLPDDFLTRYRERERALLEEQVTAIPGIDGALAALQSQQIPHAVASNGPMEKIVTTLTATGLIGCFGEHIYSAYDVGSFKPDPGLYLHAAKQLSIAPQACVVVEDSIVGARAGIAAGMRVLGYVSGPSASDMLAIGAEPFDDMSELVRLLEKQPN